MLAATRSQPVNTNQSAGHNNSGEDDEEDEVVLKPGESVESSKTTYKVQEMLGEGGFGAVFKVIDVKDEKKVYAMKVEKTIETRVHSKLKMEVRILKMIAMPKKRHSNRNHFTPLIDRGKKPEYTFVVMQLLGKSLADLKKLTTHKDKIFSIGTGLGISSQCLEACEDLHGIGFVHRDIKPANFACGLDDKTLIYMLDFGISRCVLNEKGELKGPRSFVNFKGTLKFASLSCHKNKELGPGDDCESWFYMFIDLTHPASVPWKNLTDKNDVMRRKEDIRASPNSMLSHYKAAKNLTEIFKYICGVKYHNKVDYKFLQQHLVETASISGVSMNPPYDWMK